MVRQRHRSWEGASVIEGRRGGVSETILQRPATGECYGKRESGRAGKGCSRCDSGDESLLVGGQSAEVAFYLYAVPELVRLAKESAKTNRHGRRD